MKSLSNMPPSRYGMAAPVFFILTAFFLTLTVVFALYAAWVGVTICAVASIACAWAGYRDVRKAETERATRKSAAAVSAEESIETSLSPPVPPGHAEHEPNLESEGAPEVRPDSNP